jgi:hypothetical protein
LQGEVSWYLYSGLKNNERKSRWRCKVMRLRIKLNQPEFYLLFYFKYFDPLILLSTLNSSARHNGVIKANRIWLYKVLLRLKGNQHGTKSQSIAGKTNSSTWAICAGRNE